MAPKYHIFKTWPHTTIKPGETPYSHPLLKGGRGYVVVFSVQEEDMLKVAFYYNDDDTACSTLLYISNPERRSFAGMAADATYDTGRGKDYGVRFEDGTTLYAPQRLPMPTPPDHRNGCTKCDGGACTEITILSPFFGVWETPCARSS